MVTSVHLRGHSTPVTEKTRPATAGQATRMINKNPSRLKPTWTGFLLRTSGMHAPHDRNRPRREPERMRECHAGQGEKELPAFRPMRCLAGGRKARVWEIKMRLSPSRDGLSSSIPMKYRVARWQSPNPWIQAEGQASPRSTLALSSADRLQTIV
jgi:hypothetical protein